MQWITVENSAVLWRGVQYSKPVNFNAVRILVSLFSEAVSAWELLEAGFNKSSSKDCITMLMQEYVTHIHAPSS